MAANEPPYVMADEPPYVMADEPSYVMADEPSYVVADEPSYVVADGSVRQGGGRAGVCAQIRSFFPLGPHSATRLMSANYGVRGAPCPPGGQSRPPLRLE
ncbi:MAG: hypothetical protein EPO21_19490 [Chloroflexota bacterium]|nr:MAG: hypothetical protein EPO21_19490 [Chloroflexota bacterium]